MYLLGLVSRSVIFSELAFFQLGCTYYCFYCSSQARSGIVLVHGTSTIQRPLPATGTVIVPVVVSAVPVRSTVLLHNCTVPDTVPYTYAVPYIIAIAAIQTKITV